MSSVFSFFFLFSLSSVTRPRNSAHSFGSLFSSAHSLHSPSVSPSRMHSTINLSFVSPKPYNFYTWHTPNMAGRQYLITRTFNLFPFLSQKYRSSHYYYLFFFFSVNIIRNFVHLGSVLTLHWIHTCYHVLNCFFSFCYVVGRSSPNSFLQNHKNKLSRSIESLFFF